MSDPISAEHTSPESVVQPKSEPPINVRRLRPQVPLIGIRDVTPPVKPYDASLPSDVLVMRGVLEFCSRDILVLSMPYDCKLPCADLSDRVNIYNQFKKMLDDHSEAVTKFVHAWAHKPQPAPTKPVIESIETAVAPDADESMKIFANPIKIELPLPEKPVLLPTT